jgi:hypothetical protein
MTIVLRIAGQWIASVAVQSRQASHAHGVEIEHERKPTGSPPGVRPKDLRLTRDKRSRTFPEGSRRSQAHHGLARAARWA